MCHVNSCWYEKFLKYMHQLVCVFMAVIHIVLDLQNDFLDPIKKLLCSSSSVEFKVSIKIHRMYVHTYTFVWLYVHLKLLYVHIYLEIVDHQFKRHYFVLILVCCFTIICGATATFCFNWMAKISSVFTTGGSIYRNVSIQIFVVHISLLFYLRTIQHYFNFY